MKLIIAGGRDCHLTEINKKSLDLLEISEIVSGGATGIDSDGEQYAKENNIKLTIFKADWSTHGRAAGPIRNKKMAEYADGVALFNGGRGTSSMHNEAVKAGIKIFDFRS